ncbi:MAG: DUF4145 domain-containing protein [Chloracidobacterium sp.]|nr:DUF4145 domain-containing protein [Chloracidobacterium sp.]
MITEDTAGHWAAASCICPACSKAVIFLARGRPNDAATSLENVYDSTLVRPRGSNRPPCPADVPAEIAEDYSEACLVMNDSPKASAALGRRALQHLLRASAGVKKSDLSNEIQELLDSEKLPTHIAENIDAIRNIGNFSAHPQKSSSTGEILPVEPHEAEWTLEVLEQLFDFYYVQPAKAKAKRDALNAKLAEAGKPPMK